MQSLSWFRKQLLILTMERRKLQQKSLRWRRDYSCSHWFPLMRRRKVGRRPKSGHIRGCP